MIARARAYLSGPGLGPQMVNAALGSAGIRIAGMFFAFLVGVQLARGLGAEGYGIYGIAISVVALLTVPTEFGLPQLLTREVARAQVHENWALLRGILAWSVRAIAGISITIALLVSCVLWFVDLGIDSPTGTSILVGLVLVPMVALAKTWSAALRGLQHIVAGQLADTLLRPVVFSALLFLAYLSATPLDPPVAIGLSGVAAASSLVLAGFMLKRELPQEVSRARPHTEPGKWWGSALPMALTEGMRVLQSHVVILVLGLMAATATVGVYRVAASVAIFVAFPNTLLNLVAAPVIARLHAENAREKLQRLLAWVAAATFAGTGCLLLPFAFVGESVLTYVFGTEFGAANNVLLILSGGSLFGAACGASTVLLNMTGHQRRVTRAAMIALLQLSITLPICIALLGGMGAGLASALSLATWNLLLWRDAKVLLTLDTSFVPLLTNAQSRGGVR